MGKDLFIIRHAKSDWSFAVSDFERPLNARGFKNAPQMATRLTQHTTIPTLLVSSPAKRAITTAQIFAEHLQIPVKEIVVDDRIYEASPVTLLRLVNELDNAYNEIALFGHNPGFTLLADCLADNSTADIPTCGIVHIRFDNADDWAEISRSTGKVTWFAYPKDGE